MEELYCTTRRLSEGTYLGLVLSSAPTNSVLSFFGSFEPCFRDSLLDVSRLICGALAGRLYGMEFCWLKSGGLIVRFGPYLSLSTSKRRDLPPGYTFYAFLPRDASMLIAMALCPGEPTDDFVNARFEKIFLFEDWYRLQVVDTYFQSSCMFCGSRGISVCGCPLPMRRRCMGSESEIIGYQLRVRKTFWEELRTVTSICAHRGHGLFNVTKAPNSHHAKVLGSFIAPFDFTVQLNVVTSECPQKHLGLTRQSVNAMRTVLMPFSLKDRGKQQLLPSPSSVEDEAAPSTASLEDSKEQKSSLRSSSSNDELISLIRSARKRARAHGAAAQLATSVSNTVVREEVGLSGDVVTVVDATSMAAGDALAVTKDLSSKEKCGSRSARSRSGGTNRHQAQPQWKSYACPECGMLIKSRKYNLKRHIQAVHQKEKKFGCPFTNCNQRFQTKANLKQHVSRMHKRQQVVQEQEQQVERDEEINDDDAARTDIGQFV